MAGPLISLVIMLSTVATLTRGFSSGNFYLVPGPEEQACTQRLPGHNFVPQTGPSPYSVTLSSLTYSSGSTVTVMLRGDEVTTFKGFLMQAIRVDNPAEKVGEFVAVTNTQLNCPNYGGKTISHDSDIEKPSIEFNWIAPETDLGDIYFIYTVVQIYTTYWVNETSDIITFSSLGTTTIPQTPIPLVDLTDCGDTKGCYRSPTACQDDCDYIVTWALDGTDRVNFELQGATDMGREYIAAGLSTDQNMGEDSVMDCLYTGIVAQPVEIQMSYNNPDLPKGNTPLNDSYLGLVEDSREGYFANGKLVCRFTRFVSVEGSSSPEKDKVFSLDTPYYLFIARGNVADGSKEYHGSTKIFTSQLVDLTGRPVDIGGSLPTQAPMDSIDLSSCGVSKSCYRDPAQCTTNCEYVVTWAMNGDNMIDFEVETPMGSSGKYVAIGMSKDNSMKADSVIDCIHDDQQEPPLVIQMSYNNEGEPNGNSPLSDTRLGLVSGSEEGYYSGDVLVCRFTRFVSVNDSNSPDKDKVFDLSSPHNLLVAKGDAASGQKQYHGATKVVAPEQINFTGPAVDVGGALSYPLIKAHGILMILAWMVSASFAVLMPRYNKKLWPQKTWRGKQIWFQIHMPLMTCTLLLTVAGFIVIFVSVKGYAQYEDLPAKIHPILGIITTALVIINPIMAAFRPHPGTPKRPIFNGFHFTVGLCAHVCAISCIFIAMYMPKASPPAWGKWVMVAFVCWHVLIEAAFALQMHFCFQKSENVGEKYEMTELNPDVSINDSVIKTILLTLHLMGVVAMALAIAIPIGQA